MKMKNNSLTIGAILSVVGCVSETGLNQENVKPFDSPKKEGEVINGNPAEYSSFPSIVALAGHDGSEWCSGTLIKPDFVITAAHCIPYDPGSRTIVYGVSDISQPCDGCVHEIALVKAHPEYNPSHNYGLDDIGWVLLKEPIQDAVTAEILPESVFSSALHVDDIVQIAGYGNDSNGFYGYLNSAEVPIIDFLTATGSVNGKFENKYTGSESLLKEMVVGLDNTAAPNLCYGDSGGPTYVEYNGSLFLTGVTSRVPPGKPIECGHGAVVSLPGHYQELTEKVYLELLKCKGDPDCSGNGGSGGSAGTGAGGSDVGGSGGSAGFPGYAEEPFVMLDRTNCNYSGKQNDNSGYGLLLGMAGLLGFRRRKD